MIKQWVKRTGLAIVGIILLAAAPLVYPAPLFAYGVTNDNITIFSDQPIPEKEAVAVIKETQEKMQRLPGLLSSHPMQIYIANTKWRRNWLWIIAPNAGGFVAPPATGWHTFFSGADFLTNELIAPTGYRTRPPRTIAYYGAHELTHVAISKKAGWTRFYLMPEWVREGVPDYVAMTAESASLLYAKIGKQNADLPMMKAHGVYAPYRLLVTWFLQDAGWTLERLMASDLTLQQARKIVFNALDG